MIPTAAKYIIIARELELQLRRGLEEGQRLPTEAALCQQYGCSRQTVRSALGLLEQKGLIVRRQGSGSFPARGTQPRNRQIAVVLADREEYLAPSILREIRRAAREAGFALSCLETGGSWAREAEHLAYLTRQRPAGIILEPFCDVLGCCQEEALGSVLAARIPLVYLGGRYALPAPAVLSDDALGAELLMTHLSATGHRTVAAILKADESRGLIRYRSLLRQAEEASIRFAPENCLWYAEQERQRLLEGDEALLRRFQSSYRRDCSAVVCFNDELAFRLQRFLRAARTPMSVVSFDNSYLALTQDASLTTLGFPEETPGAAAVRSLLSQMEGHSPGDILLPWHLHTRKSG